MSFRRELIIVRCDWFNDYVQVIGRDQALRRIVHPRLIPVAVDASYQRQLVVLEGTLYFAQTFFCDLYFAQSFFRSCVLPKLCKK